MRKFILGERYAAIPKTTENSVAGITLAAYEEYKRELLDAIGVDFVGGPGAPIHVAEQDGYFFINYFPSAEDSPYEHIRGTPIHPKGEIMCGNCGGFEFHIFYGSHECFGTCVKCDKQYSLYSG